MRRHIVRVASAWGIAFLAAVILPGVLVGILAVQAVNIPQSVAATPPQPTNTTAFHRSGQTFITWTERADLSGERYHVYRHTSTITAGNLAQATRLTDTWGAGPYRGSARNCVMYGARINRSCDNGLLSGPW